MDSRMSVNPFSHSPGLNIIEVEDEITDPHEATDSPYHPDNFNANSFEPEPESYTMTSYFHAQTNRPSKAKGVFKGKVIRACFDGTPMLLENYLYGKPDYERPASAPDELASHLVLMAAEIDDSDTWFGLLLDPVNKTVVSGHVLQVSPVLASQVPEEGMNSVPLWTEEEIERMKRICYEHNGSVRNAFDDPTADDGDGEKQSIGEDWNENPEHHHPVVRFGLSNRLKNKF